MGAAVPGNIVCMYGAAVKCVRLEQMYHDYHGQRMLSIMRCCKINDERCREFSEGWEKTNNDLLGKLCYVATECAKYVRQKHIANHERVGFLPRYYVLRKWVHCSEERAAARGLCRAGSQELEMQGGSRKHARLWWSVCDQRPGFDRVGWKVDAVPIGSGGRRFLNPGC
jgi:hypothetical protein